ncbi:LytR/AlgR family response regulator transcription factor [Mucilaginibacter agri]|uniref:Response regulator n=1 Tax=Mucilaginibacter agri TaxID=2695265 RepID=A0A965ZFE1_9SPHI|nr:LytTR family DNA-binding domain-containing protein [Mucilaginibacter agri]NCD69102.1 response regulator [Mucilaginibacter agri]
MIIDDEPYAVELLELFIQKSSDWTIISKCYDAAEAMLMIKSNAPQVIFLDINMPGLNGLELAQLLPANVRVVFTTAYSEHAAESYNYQTLDYLLKPLTLKRFLATVQKVETHFSIAEAAAGSNISKDTEHFYIKSGKTLHKIFLDDILYFEGQKEYVCLVTSLEKILIYRRLKDIEQQFSMPFVRVHNSYIINTRHLVKVMDNHIYLAGIQIPISDKFRNSFMSAIRQSII